MIRFSAQIQEVGTIDYNEPDKAGVVLKPAAADYRITIYVNHDTARKFAARIYEYVDIEIRSQANSTGNENGN